jgi:O-antigen/teichoic acid export membrane protein
VVLNLFLIPKFSFAGAAIATAITEVALFISYYYFVAKHFHRLELHTFFIRPCLACLAMGIFVFYLKSINLALLVITAAIIYLVVLYFVKGFDEEDKAIFKNLKEGIAVGRNFR